jgi:hypothetical protein
VIWSSKEFGGRFQGHPIFLRSWLWQSLQQIIIKLILPE